MFNGLFIIIITRVYIHYNNVSSNDPLFVEN